MDWAVVIGMFVTGAAAGLTFGGIVAYSLGVQDGLRATRHEQEAWGDL